MCIRDRTITRERPTGPDLALLMERHTADMHADTPPESIHTVSYTHLRAHETVLDLVCRLLLEKKKKKKFKIERRNEAQRIGRTDTNTRDTATKTPTSTTTC